MTDEELHEIRNRCEKATGEPWILLYFGRNEYIIQTAGEEDLDIIGATEADYYFIADAKQDVITLLNEIENIHSNQYTLNDNELEKIRNKCKKATGGKWTAYIEGRDIECGSSFIQTAGEDLEITGATVEDYDFIAHAKQDVILLLDEIEKLRSQC